MECFSEKVDRVLKKCGLTTAMRPHATLGRLLIHQKDKCTKFRVSVVGDREIVQYQGTVSLTFSSAQKHDFDH